MIYIGCNIGDNVDRIITMLINNEVFGVFVGGYIIQIIGVMTFMLIAGLINDPNEVGFKKKITFFKWLLPYYMISVYLWTAIKRAFSNMG